MSLDEQLSALLAQLGVVLEESDDSNDADDAERRETRETYPAHERRERFIYGAQASEAYTSSEQIERRGATHEPEGDESDDFALEIEALADISLFQTSREHYGVFYRLDLVAGLPQLRIFMPEDEGALKMRCYLVRAAANTPLRSWFLTSHAHQGSRAYEDARDAAHQHLLFAAGELMKRLFWTGEQDEMRFPPEISVVRLV